MEVFYKPTQMNAERVYTKDGPILIGFIFNHPESSLWHGEYPVKKIHVTGNSRDEVIAKLWDIYIFKNKN